MTVENATIRLHVNDGGAVYPLVVDPLIQEQELTASDGAAGDEFGYAVALSADGTTALIGAYSKNSRKGAAYVFVRSSGTWSQQTTPPLTASDGAANDEFGYAVALSADGTTALIGALFKNSAKGAAYVFVRSSGTWSQQTTPPLTASDGAAGDSFGIAVALSADGNTALIGAYSKNSYRGAAYVFVRSSGTWSQQTTPPLTASDGAAGDTFGWSVALSADGTTALIGAYSKNSRKGAAYVFVRSGTSWSQQTTPSLLASDGAAGDSFGWSVALSADGTTALIGAYSKNSNKGAAYVFVRSSGTWSQQTTPPLTASDGAAGDSFGWSVALSADGTTALIGALFKNSAKGAAYVFVRSSGTWSQQTTPPLTASDGAAGDSFGIAVALSADGNTALIGAYSKNSYKGAAYLFTTPTLHLIAPASSPCRCPLLPHPLRHRRHRYSPAAYTGPVHFSSSDPHATLPANFSFAPADNGTHVFTNGATLTTAGSQSVTATDTASATVTGSASLTILAGSATTLTANAGTTPQSAAINAAFATPLSVTATDTFGNPVSGVIVTFTAPGGGTTGSFPGLAPRRDRRDQRERRGNCPRIHCERHGRQLHRHGQRAGYRYRLFALTNAVAASDGRLAVLPALRSRPSPRYPPRSAGSRPSRHAPHRPTSP